MKNQKFLVSCAVAGLLLGSQAVRADEHAEKTGKNGCQGKNACKGEEGKNSCKGEEGKNSCKAEAKKKDEKHGCGANGCGAVEEKKK